MWRMWTVTFLKHHFVFLWTNPDVDSLSLQANTSLSQHFLEILGLTLGYEYATQKNTGFISSHIY